jgi:hypothetical protein
MHPYERWIICRYLANALKSSRFIRPPSADTEIFSWIDGHSRFLGLPKLACRTPSSRRRLMRIEQLDQLGEVGERARQPVDLVDDDHVDPVSANVVEQPLERRPLHRARNSRHRRSGCG